MGKKMLNLRVLLAYSLKMCTNSKNPCDNHIILKTTTRVGVTCTCYTYSVYVNRKTGGRGLTDATYFPRMKILPINIEITTIIPHD